MQFLEEVMEKIVSITEVDKQQEINRVLNKRAFSKLNDTFGDHIKYYNQLISLSKVSAVFP